MTTPIETNPKSPSKRRIDAFGLRYGTRTIVGQEPQTTMRFTVEDVQNFWEAAPLWKGESQFATGTREFFEEHRQVVIDDCFAGQLDERIFPTEASRGKVLDLGCGPGFWLVELSRRGCSNLVGADLTNTALELARKRCEIFQIPVSLARQNAEKLDFPDGIFSHVNCQGVIHHTPDTQACVREIARVIKPGGTASISVYHRGILLKAWPYIRPVGKVLTALGGGLQGRGRENIFLQKEVDEIVRLYDGSTNPIGKCYTTEQFVKMLSPYFEVKDTFLHFFPSRTLPVKLPTTVHRILDRTMGLLVYASLRKI